MQKDFNRKILFLVIAGVIFFVDQMTKAWVAQKLRFGDNITFIPNFLNFSHAQNSGVAFSFLDNHGDLGRYGLSVVAGLAASYFIISGVPLGNTHVCWAHLLC